MGSEELFHYDAMNRLVTARKRELDAVNLDLWDLPTPGGDWDQQTESRYDGQYSGGDDPDGVAPGAGNLTHKGGVSQYYGDHLQCDPREPTEPPAGPHAVCAAGPEGGEATVQYTYDDNGNQIQRQTNDTVDRSIDYTVFNKAWRVSSGQGTTKFWYDAERRRFKREDVGERFVFYIANTEVIRQNGTTTYRRQVAGAMVRFEPHNDQDVANSPRAYRITDHLGSAVAVHRVGSVNPWLHRQFAAFGATVNANAGGGALAGFAVWTDRGFTGHESVQSAGIVHMKGRIYDPELGRFLQADPFVQAPDNSQSLNRYSYVLNNPLSYTDPSGFFFKSLLSSVFQTVFTIAGCSVPGANVVTCFTTATMVSGMTGAANDQPFLNAVRDGAISGVTAVAFMQVGAAVRAGHISPEAGVVLHGAVGAGAAAARGGDPLAGFAAAVLTKSFTLGAEGFLDQINNDAIESLIAGAVGGTISEVTGGKFANGAVTAAIAYVYNQAGHRRNNPPTVNETIDALAKLFEEEFGPLSLDEAKISLKAAASGLTKSFFEREASFLDNLESMSPEQRAVALKAAATMTLVGEVNEFLGKATMKQQLRRLTPKGAAKLILSESDIALEDIQDDIDQGFPEFGRGVPARQAGALRIFGASGGFLYECSFDRRCPGF